MVERIRLFQSNVHAMPEENLVCLQYPELQWSRFCLQSVFEYQSGVLSVFTDAKYISAQIDGSAFHAL